MKRAVIAVVLVAGLLIAVRILTKPKNDDTKEEPRIEVKYPDEGRWGSVDLPNGIRLSLPEGWAHYTGYSRIDGFIFRRVESVDGFWPNVHVYWKKQPRSLEDWFDLLKSKRRGGGSRILGEGKAVTAGMPGYHLTYETKSKQKDGTEVVTVTKDWYFKSSDGYGGILRGISTARTFLEPFGAIFDNVQQRLRRN